MGRSPDPTIGLLEAAEEYRDAKKNLDARYGHYHNDEVDVYDADCARVHEAETNLELAALALPQDSAAMLRDEVSPDMAWEWLRVNMAAVHYEIDGWWVVGAWGIEKTSQGYPSPLEAVRVAMKPREKV